MIWWSHDNCQFRFYFHFFFSHHFAQIWTGRFTYNNTLVLIKWPASSSAWSKGQKSIRDVFRKISSIKEKFIKIFHLPSHNSLFFWCSCGSRSEKRNLLNYVLQQKIAMIEILWNVRSMMLFSLLYRLFNKLYLLAKLIFLTMTSVNSHFIWRNKSLSISIKC